MPDHLAPWTLLSPAPGVCQTCAVEHPEAMAHDAQSLYYQYAFYQEHGRWPTWGDAIAHCDDDVKRAWTEALAERGVTLDGPVSPPR